MNKLPTEYVVLKFHQYNGAVKYNKSLKTYQGSCAMCKEGSSWLKKRRCYYLVDENVICCHNCGWYSSPLKWIKEVSGDSFSEIIKESEEFDTIVIPSNEAKKESTHTLPYDSINLFDINQLNFYKTNSIITTALDVIKHRKIDIAINKPKTLWVSLKDGVHKNRLIIPFYNLKGDIIFYQSRTLLEQDAHLPKYLSKRNSEKSLYGVENVDTNKSNIFIFEGPINSFFCKNAVAVGGIQEKSIDHFTPLQTRQLHTFSTLRKIWCLDSQWIDDTSLAKTKTLIKQQQHVFIWPEKVGRQFKDFNDIAISLNKGEIPEQFILKNTFSGISAEAKLLELITVRGNHVPLQSLTQGTQLSGNT